MCVGQERDSNIPSGSMRLVISSGRQALDSHCTDIEGPEEICNKEACLPWRHILYACLFDPLGNAHKAVWAFNTQGHTETF